MKKTILILVLLIASNAFAQPSFNKITGIFGVTNLGIDTANRTFQFDEQYLHIYNSQGDTIGNYTFKVNYANPACDTTLGLFKIAYPRNLNHNSMSVVGYVADTADTTCSLYQGLLAKYNLNIGKEWERKFAVNNSNNVGALFTSQNDSEIIACGGANTSLVVGNLFNPIIIVFDTAGNLKWCDRFDLLDAYPVSIIQTTDGGSILGMNVKEIGATLLKVDNVGNVLWCKSYYRNKSLLLKVIEGESGNIYLTGMKDTTFNASINNLDSLSSFLIKVDSLGNPIWGKSYGSALGVTQIFHMVFNNYNNELITVGEYSDSINHGSFFMKLTQSGDTTQSPLYYTRSQYTLRATAITSIDSINYLIGGKVNNFTTFAGTWLFTADSNGYGICNGFPGTIGYSSFIPVDSNIIVTYTTGATVVASNDIYTVGVQPFNVQDGCLYTGEQTVTAATNLLVISPNPSHAVFTIALPDKANQNNSFFLSVYDEQGKLVQQQTTKMGTEKINLNLASQPTGIYNIVVTNGRVVYNGKIVLER